MPVLEECGIFRTRTQRRFVRPDRSRMRAPIIQFIDSVDHARRRLNRKSAGRTGSPLSEASAPLLSVEQPAPWSCWRSCQGRRTHLVSRGCKPQINVMHPGATSHVRVTAVRLSVDLLAIEIASPGSSGRQRRGQVSGRLTP